jgi:hypothetical protein
MNDLPDDIKEVFPDDDDWLGALHGKSDEELIVFMRKVCDALSVNIEALPDGITPERIDEMRVYADRFEVTVEQEKIAIENNVVARSNVAHIRARIESISDAMLTKAATRKTTGH